MDPFVRSLLQPRDGSTRVAVIGASNASFKYGNIITLDLLVKGFTVLPINPGEAEVEGLRAWPTVSDAPGPIHIANFVVPPALSLEILADLDPAAVSVVWFQPGSFDARVVAAARARFDHVLAGECILVET